MTSGSEGLAPREGGEMTQLFPQPCGAGSMVHSSMGAPGKGLGRTGSTQGFVLARPALPLWLLLRSVTLPQQLPLSPSCVPTPSSSVPSPLASALGGFGPLLSSSAAPCPGGSGGEGGARCWSPALMQRTSG